MGETQREQALRGAAPEQLLQTLKTLGRNKEELQGLLQELLAENTSLQISRKKLREEKAELQRELEQQRRDLSLFQAVLLDLGIPTFPELLPRQGAKGKKRQEQEGPALTRETAVTEALGTAAETGSAAWAKLGDYKAQATAAAAGKGAIEFFTRRLPWLQEGGGARPQFEPRGAPTCSSSPSVLHTTHHEPSSQGPPSSSNRGPSIGEGIQKGAPKALLESLKTTFSREAPPRSPAAGGAPSLLDLLAEKEAASRCKEQQRETGAQGPIVEASEAAAQCSSEDTSSCSSNGCNSSININSSRAESTSRPGEEKSEDAATRSDKSCGDSNSSSSSSIITKRSSSSSIITKRSSSSSKINISSSSNSATQEQWNCRARLLALQIGEALGLERSSGAFAAAAEAATAAAAATAAEAAPEVTNEGRQSASIAAAAAISSTAEEAGREELLSGVVVAAAVEANAASRDSPRPSLSASSALQQPLPAPAEAAKPRPATPRVTAEIGPPSASQASTGPLLDLPSLTTKGPQGCQPVQAAPLGGTSDEHAKRPAGQASCLQAGAPCGLIEGPPHPPTARSEETFSKPQSADHPEQGRGVKACELLPLQTTPSTTSDRRCSSNSTSSRRSSSTSSSTGSREQIAAAAAPDKQHHRVAGALESSRAHSKKVGASDQLGLVPSPAPKTLWGVPTPTQQQVPATAPPPTSTKVAAAAGAVEAGRPRPALEASEETVQENSQKVEGPILEVDVVSVGGGGLRVDWEVKGATCEGPLQLQACVLDCSSSTKHQQQLLHSSSSPLVISSLRSSGNFHLTLLVKEQPQEEEELQQQRPLCGVSIQLALEEGRILNKRIRPLPVNRLSVRGLQSPKGGRGFSGAKLVGAPTPRSSPPSVNKEAATSQKAAQQAPPIDNVRGGPPTRKEAPNQGGPCGPVAHEESSRVDEAETDHQIPSEHSHTKLRGVCTPEGPASRAEEQPSTAAKTTVATAGAKTPRSAVGAAVKPSEAAVVPQPADAPTASALAPPASVAAQPAAAAAAPSPPGVSPRSSAAAARAAAAKAAAMMDAPIPPRLSWIPPGPQGAPLPREGAPACEGPPQLPRGAPNLQLTRTYLREMIRTSSGAPTGGARQRSLTPIRGPSQTSWMPCGPQGAPPVGWGPPPLPTPTRSSWTPWGPFVPQPTQQSLDTTQRTAAAFMMKGPLPHGAPNAQEINGFGFGMQQGPQLAANPAWGLSTQRWACTGAPLPYQGGVAAAAGGPPQMSGGVPWPPAFPATKGGPLAAQDSSCMGGPPQTTVASPVPVEQEPLRMQSWQSQGGISTAGEVRVQGSRSFVRGPPMWAPQASVYVHPHTGAQCNPQISTAASVRRGSLTQVCPPAAMGPPGFTWTGRDGVNNMVQGGGPLNISLGAPKGSGSRRRSVTPTYKPTAFLREALNSTLKGPLPPAPPAAQPYPVTPRTGPSSSAASSASFRVIGGPPMTSGWGTTAVPPVSRMSLSLPQESGPSVSARVPDATLSGAPQKPGGFSTLSGEAQDPRLLGFVSGYQWQQQQDLLAQKLQMQQFQVHQQVQQQQLQQRQQQTVKGLQETSSHEHQRLYKGSAQQPIAVPRDTMSGSKQQQHQPEQQQQQQGRPQQQQQQQQQQQEKQVERQKQQEHPPSLPLRRIRGLDPPPHEEKLTQWVCLSQRERQAREAGPA
ncbi:hypothetical protein Emed_001444 [Eimeria media]